MLYKKLIRNWVITYGLGIVFRPKVRLNKKIDKKIINLDIKLL